MTGKKQQTVKYGRKLIENKDNKFPLSKTEVETIIQEHPTPWHIYDEKGIRETARRLNKAFTWAPGFKNYFAVKALPNPRILGILHEEGFGADCSSLPELILASKAGIDKENIMFTSNNTPQKEFEEARHKGALINLDDISHISSYIALPGNTESYPVCFRYNPGPLRKGNTIIGNPEEAKYGLTKKQLFEAYNKMREISVKRFGLHTMIASNERDPQYFVETAKMLFELVAEISAKLRIRFEFINMGGGLGIPYKPDQEPIDLNIISKGVRKVYGEIIERNGLHPLKIFMENGRFITGPHGWLVTQVLHLKHIYKDYVGCDACMANLMRPGMYGVYHHITVLGKESLPTDHIYDVTGSLCENNDKFAINRYLPEIEKGNLLAIHDTGAHGYAMGFNYNGKLKSAELLLKEDGTIEQIRRAETIEDYFATLDFSK
jgi:diaminopimelate decarboxylase